MKRIKFIYLLGLIFSFISLGQVNAQYKVSAKYPQISQLKPINSFRSVEKQCENLVLDELNSEEFRSVNLKDKPSEFRVYRFAINRSLELDFNKIGEWLLDNEGHYVWTFSITSPKALSCSLLLEDYELAKGAKLFVYGQIKTNRALTSINNSSSKTLQLVPIEGEKINLMYVAPEGDKSKKLPFRITRLSHGFRSLRGIAARELYNCDTGEPYFNLENNSLPEIACAENVVKHEAEDLQARSVVLLITDGDTMSTASLINNTKNDGTPYLLTASHCVNRIFGYPNDLERVKKTVTSAVVFFGFESPSPNRNIRGSEEKTISGAELVAYNTKSDMALIKLTGLPTDEQGQKFIPPAYNPYFSGWNISSKPKGEFYNIHHPIASTKRFNLSKDIDLELLPEYSVKDLIFRNKHWLITEWAIGTTAAGSSGSPLFDNQGHIIGALTGGVSDCKKAYSDKFFAIYKTWQGADPKKSLKPWLDPDNSHTQVCEGYDPNKDKKVYRLSEFYGQEQKVDTYQGNDNALARFLEIEGDGEMEILGAYYVFKGNKDLQLNFPKHILELCPVKGKKVEPAIWTSEVNSPSYRYFNQEKSAFETNNRTILADTVEVFQAQRGVKIKAGKYILALRREAEDQPIKLPILKSNDGKKANSCTFHALKKGQWGEISQEAIWLDLVLQSSKKITTSIKTRLITEPLFYYAQGKLFAYINQFLGGKESTSLKIYDLSGRLYYQHRQLTLGQNSFNLSSLPRQNTYIAVLHSEGRTQTIKFRHQ